MTTGGESPRSLAMSNYSARSDAAAATLRNRTAEKHVLEREVR